MAPFSKHFPYLLFCSFLYSIYMFPLFVVSDFRAHPSPAHSTQPPHKQTGQKEGHVHKVNVTINVAIFVSLLLSPLCQVM